MTEFETLIKVLAVRLGENPSLRHALAESILAILGEEERRGEKDTAQLSYLDLLERIEEDRLLAQKQGRTRISETLKGLEDQLRYELHQSTLSLHHALRSGQLQSAEEHVRRVGIDVKNFPVGFPQGINLLKLSEIWLKAVRDLHFLHTHFPDRLPEVIRKIEEEKQRAVRWLQEVAWEALAAESARHGELSMFRKAYLDPNQRWRTEAEHELSSILQETNTLRSPESVRKIERWLQKFTILSRHVLKDLSPKYKQAILELLVRTRDYTGLEALIVIDPEKIEKDRFETFMTLRFGEEFRDSIQTWKTWLKQNLDQATKRQEAVTFWQHHPYNIPALLAEHVENLEVPESLNTRMLQEIGEIRVEDFLESRRLIMTGEEIQILETVQVPEQDSSKDTDLVSPIVQSAVEVAIDYAIRGKLPESTLITTAKKSSKAIENRLTVTIEEDEELQVEPILSPVLSGAEGEEPAESIWSDHIFPFVTRNLVFVLAPSFIFIGLLLLVFTLWDKAAWIRYGLTPFMIVSISYALSRIGLWLKGEDIKSNTPIVIMQSVSILLAPLSLFFVALLSVDRELAFMIRVIGGVFLSVALLAAWSYIFVLSIRTIYRVMAGIHSLTLLLLNALLLLLPIAQLTIKMADTLPGAGHLAVKTILVVGFYTGFLVLCWSMRRVLGKMLETGPQATGEALNTFIPMVFYSVTCLGTFVLVWGLTHARLMLLPQPYTYSPLLLLFSFLISMVEFKLLEIQHQTGRITSLSYAVYFFIGLGVLLSIGHDYIRVVALLLAGLVWLYQALKLHDIRHFKIAIVILTGASSMIALIRGFPAPFFPYLALIVVLGLYVLARALPFPEGALFATSLSSIYLSFAFIASIVWQWTKNIPPLNYGIAFVLFGLCALYLGANTDTLIHVHAGAGYIVAALPYLGFMDLNLYTLEGNTLVFGLSVVGIFWVLLSSVARNPAIKDSRSTVLWNIGILAFCILCLRVIFKDTLDMSAGSFQQFQTLSGPILIGGLMLLMGYFTQSYIPVYLGLFILVIIFPEIRDRFQIPMYSGMGSTMSGIGFLMLALVLRLWKRLYESGKNDLIWRKKPFPFQAKNYYLVFADPIVVAAFFLFTRTIFVTYPTNYFKPLFPFSIKTPLAVLLCGIAYHFFSVWNGKKWFSYIGFIAIFFGIVHSFYMYPGLYPHKPFLPLFLLAAFIYCEGLCLVCSRILPAEKAKLITNPFRHLKYLAIWTSALGIYLFYSVYYNGRAYEISPFSYWIPLLLYLCGVSGWIAWNVKRPGNSWFFLIPGYLLFWQLVVLITTRGKVLPDVLVPSPSTFYLSTSLMVLAIASAFFVFERVVTQEKFRVLSPMLWISLVFLLVFSLFLVAIFYMIPNEFPNLLPQILVWVLVSFVIGRFLNLGPLWLWGVFLVHLLVLPPIMGYTRFYVSLHPFTLACIAIFLSGLSVITAKVKWLYEHRYSYPWVQNKRLSPSFLFAAASHLVVFFVFLQAVSVHYRHSWMTVIGLFLATLPALFAAHQLGFSRRFLFGVPYTLACVALVLAIRVHFPENNWLVHLKTPHLISCGLFGALLTAVISDYFLGAINRSLQEDVAYRALKYIAAAGIILLILYAYLTTRNIELISWPRLVTSGILTLGAGLYFRLMISDEHKGTCYSFFVYGLTLSMLCFSIVLVKYVFHIPLTPKTPETLFWIFTLPPLWFYLRSEYNRAVGRIYTSGRNATAELLFYLLALYLFPHLVRFSLFPSYSPNFLHYVYLAPVALLVGLLLIRLHALDGGAFLIFAGVITDIVALFFLATRIPELIFGEIPQQPPGKTFEFFALIAIFLSYFFLITTRKKGLMRKVLTQLGNIQEDLWQSLRNALFPLLLGVCHVLFFITLLDLRDQKLIGIIFLFLAGLWVYAGYSFRNVFLYSFAYAEIVVAIFSCRFSQAYWQETWIIWLLFALFILLIPIYSLFLRQKPEGNEETRLLLRGVTGSFYTWLSVTAALIIYEHITFYGLHSKLGISALFILWIATFCVPVEITARTQPLFKTFLGTLMYCPALFFFLLQGTPPIEQLPRVVLVAVITSYLMLTYRVYNWQWLSDDPSTEFILSLSKGSRTIRIAHHLHWFLTQPHSFVPIFFVSTLAVFLIHYLSYSFDPKLFANQFFSLIILQGILAVYWFDRTQKDRVWWWTVFAEAMLTGLVVTVRWRIFMLDIHWTADWDVIIGWFAALTITAMRPLLNRQDRSVRIPIRFTLFGLPVITIMYALKYPVGFNTLSTVIFLYSVIFLWQAYSEKDRYILAYSFLGFNAYLIMFLLRHEIQSLQAYITPVCLSILFLVQVFRDITSSATANLVRGVTLCILLGTAMFQAIVENYHSPWAHLILIALSTLAMIAAGLLCIRIFAAAGLFCFILDLIAIVYIVLSQQDTETLKVILGVGLTLGGGLILTGYILYRKNKKRVDEFIEGKKKTFYSWE